MILDAGFLFSVDRGEDRAREFLTAAARASVPLRASHPVVAQVWRSGTQARLGSFLESVLVLPFDDGRAVGQLLASAGTTDVVDAHLIVLAVHLGDAILTDDVDDLEGLAEFLGPAKPSILTWP